MRDPDYASQYSNTYFTSTVSHSSNRMMGEGHYGSRFLVRHNKQNGYYNAHGAT